MRTAPSAQSTALLHRPGRHQTTRRPPADRLAAPPAEQPLVPPSDAFTGARWATLCAVSDAIVLWMALVGAVRILGRPVPTRGIEVLAGMGALVLARMAQRGMYGRRPERMSQLDGARETVGAVAWAGAGALAFAALSGIGGTLPQTIVWACVLSGAALTALRVVLAQARRRACRHGLSGRITLIVGAGYVGAQLERRMLARPQDGLVPVGFLDADAPSVKRSGRQGPVLGSPSDLEAIAARTGARQVIVAFSNAPDSEVLPLIRRCEELNLDVAVVPRLFENVNDRQWIEHVGGLPLTGLRRVDPKSWQFNVKHALDRAVAGALLLAVAPLMAMLALTVRLSSPGPVLFRQRRIGRDGQAFDILKFRSMRVDPRPTKDEHTTAFGRDCAPGGIEGADRRTAVGSFLRRSSLDELPQLINVLCGHMSLVGPRPERPEFVAMFGTGVRRYGDRHRVKSGMTGWAQVHGLRGQTSLSERVEWDNFYIQNWSLWLDLKILLMTPLAVVQAPPEGAAATPSPVESTPAPAFGELASMPVGTLAAA